jgi:hypothetical protein
MDEFMTGAVSIVTAAIEAGWRVDWTGAVMILTFQGKEKPL